jgi:hypothetical protein
MSGDRFGYFISFLSSFQVYEPFLSMDVKTTSDIFTATAEAYVNDSAEAEQNEKKSEEFIRVFKKYPDLFPDPHLAARKYLYYFEKKALDSTLLLLYLIDQKKFRSFVDLDQGEFKLVKDVIDKYQSALFVSPHCGPYMSFSSIIKDILQVDLAVYQNFKKEEMPFVRKFFAASGYPDRLKPLTIDPDAVSVQSITYLKSGVSVQLLSDISFSKNKSEFKSKICGIELHAPSGQVRIAHNAQKPIIGFMIVKLGDAKFKILMKVLYVPSPEDLDNPTIQKAVDSIFGFFSDGIMVDPVSWDRWTYMNPMGD